MEHTLSRFYLLLLWVVVLIFLSLSFLPVPGRVTESTPARAAEAVSESRATSFDTIATNLGDYLWPTDASRIVTSSFAEYRSTHFHGGIDISTNGQTGHNVFASRDGYVYRIVISPFGYGKMLFLKHPDGYVTAYAHLMTFNDAINRAAHEEQYRRGTYAIDLTLEPSRIPVSKGEIVAYSGNTGYGPPHLHFEIRDENMNPMNPLLCSSFRLEDNMPPRINRVIITPLSFNSTVDNSPRARYFNRFPRRKKAYVIPQTIRISGQIGFAIEAIDNVNGTRSKSGIHRVEFYLDDSLAFALQLDRVPVKETKQIDLHYDFPSILEGRGKFQKLYLETGNSLPFYDHRPEGAGIINTEQISEGSHRYTIVCKDARGNATELEGTLMACRKPSVRIARVDEDDIVVTGSGLESISQWLVYGRMLNETRWSAHPLPREKFEAGGTGIELPLKSTGYDVLKVVAETKTGEQSDPVFYFKKKSHGDPQKIEVEAEPFNDYTKITLSTHGMFTAQPEAVVHEGSIQQRVALDAIDVNKYTGAFQPTDMFVGTRTIEVSAEVNGSNAAAQQSFDVFPVPARHSGSFSLPGNGIIVSFDSGAVFKPLYMRSTEETIRGLLIYEFEPTDVLLNRGVTFSLPVPPDADKRHLGLYFRSTGNWIFQTATPVRGYFTTTMSRTLGDLALLHDGEPPTIGRLRVLARNMKVFVSFRYQDNLSGVDPDEIKLYIDKMPVIPEIDGEHRKVSYQSDNKLEPGKHSLKIILKDRMKNESELSRSFSVK